MIYFTSDLHLCHDREFVYKSRGFSSVKEMNETIIERWNSVVNDSDTIYVLGDIMLNDNEEGIRIWNKLHGYKMIIPGNHDTNARIDLYMEQPKTYVIGMADIIHYGKFRIYISHYPTITSNVDETHLSQHLLNFYGHTHQKTNFYNDIPWFYHVGMDSHDCTPISIEDVLMDIRNEYNKCKEML